MKKSLLFSLLPMLAASSLSATDLKGELENVYVKAANTLLFFTSEDIISSGTYTFDNDDQTLHTFFFPMTYQFKSDSDFYNFYADGSIGYSKYREKNLLFRGSNDEIDIKTYALKAGGGIRLNIAKDTQVMLGASYIYSKADSDYKTPKPLGNDLVDSALNYVFNSNNHFNTYELYGEAGYHPVIDGYAPYAEADIRYFNTMIDDPYIDDTTSTVSKLKLGVVTPPVANIAHMPIKLEFYAWDVLVFGDMQDALDMDNFYVAGMTLHFDTAHYTDLITGVKFDINLVKGDKIDGINFGFGLDF